MAKSPLLLGKRSRLHGQKTVSASFLIYSCVNYDISWRQFNKALTPTCMAGHGMKRFWSQAQSGLATGGFVVGHGENSSLTGEGIDFAGRRNGLAPTTEKSGVLSPRAVSLHPPKGDRFQSASPSPRQNPEWRCRRRERADRVKETYLFMLGAADRNQRASAGQRLA